MIIFSDFDGTLYFKNEPEKTAANLKALRRWKSAGHQFCITTGRSYTSVTNAMPELKDLCDYYIVDCGSLIFDRDNRLLHSICFDSETVNKITDFFHPLSETLVPVYFTAKSTHYEPTSDEVTKIQFWFKRQDVIKSTNETCRATLPVLSFYAYTGSSHPKLASCVGYMEITPEAAGKEVAINILAHLKNYPLSDILTFGDGENDEKMLRQFSGYAIKNSTASNLYPDLKTTDSIATTIDSLIS